MNNKQKSGLLRRFGKNARRNTLLTVTTVLITLLVSLIEVGDHTHWVWATNLKQAVTAPNNIQNFYPGDDRLNGKPSDRVAVYCNQATGTIGVYVVNNAGQGTASTEFSGAAVVAAGSAGLTRNLGANGSVTIHGNAQGNFWLAWTGGPYGANGQGDFSKTVACSLPIDQNAIAVTATAVQAWINQNCPTKSASRETDSGIGELTYSALPSGAAKFDAQTNFCSDVIKKALSVTSNRCLATDRNQVCYGNSVVDAEAQPGVTDFPFHQPGDVVGVRLVHTLKVGPFSTDANTWGVTVMKLQANLPDTVRGQVVTVMLFGDVNITDASQEQANYKPMQAFYFRTGIGQGNCKEVPPDGVLLESPQGKQKIELTANGTKLSIGSTVFLQAPQGRELVVNVLNGSVVVTAGGQSQTVGTGFRVRVPLDGSTTPKPTAAPGTLEPLDRVALQSLPLTTLRLLAFGPAQPQPSTTPPGGMALACP